MRDTHTRSRLVAGLALLTCGVPGAVSWILNAAVPSGSDKIIFLPTVVYNLYQLGAGLLVAAATFLLVTERRRGRLVEPWNHIVFLVVVAGMIAGLVLWILSGPWSSGAPPILFGYFVLVGVPITLILHLFGWTWAVAQLRQDRRGTSVAWKRHRELD